MKRLVAAIVFAPSHCPDRDEPAPSAAVASFPVGPTSRDRNWDGDGGGLTGTDDPQERLEDGASANSVLTEWNNVDNVNGVR